MHSRTLYAIKALSTALRQPPDLVISAHLYHGPLAAMIAGLTGARLVTQLHGTEVWTRLTQEHVRALERSDLVLCVSRDTRARVRAQANLTDERVLVVSNMVADVFKPGDRAAIRERLGLSGKPMLLTVARLDPRDGYKGHDLVIDALHGLAGGNNTQLVYWIAGDGEDRGRLERRAHDLGVADRVRFLGKLSRAELVDLYRAADLFVLPSAGEGFGIVFIEAMACGTPALGLAIGGAPDALGDGELGWCVEAVAIEEALEAALMVPRADDPGLFERVSARFGKKVFESAIDTVLHRVMN